MKIKTFKYFKITSRSFKVGSIFWIFGDFLMFILKFSKNPKNVPRLETSESDLEPNEGLFWLSSKSENIFST